MWRDFPNSCATDVTIFFPNSHVKIYSSEKPFGCFSCDKIFSLNSHVKIHSNEKPLLRWQEIFLNSYYYGSCMLQLFVCKVQGCCFRNFEKWKVFLWSSQMVIHLSVFWQGSLENFLSHEWQSNGFSYESILTQEVGNFLVTWVTAKWFLIWVYSDMRVRKISCHMSSSQMVFILSVFLHDHCIWNWAFVKISFRMSSSQMVFHLSVLWQKWVRKISCHIRSSQMVFHLSVFWHVHSYMTVK